IYGLGAILYALLTGRPPFRGETVLDTLQQVKESEPERVRSINPKVDRDLETICLKCLQKEPSGRHNSAEALAEDLDHFLKGEPIRARSINRLVKWGRWCRRHKALVFGVGMPLATLVVVGAVTIWWQGRQNSATADAVNKLLNEAVSFQRQEKWAEAV